MNIVKSDEMIRDLTAMKQFGYDAIAIDGMVKALKEKSVEGAVSVLYSKWEDADDGDGYVCSNCGYDYCNILKGVYKFEYCPHCGAKMQDIDFEEE